MTDHHTHVIVGASLAGAKAAETLRAEGFEGRVLLIGAERYRPYERPPLSKQLLRGEATVDDGFVHPESFYADNDIELRLDTCVHDISPAERVVHLRDGDPIGYDRLLIATGARPRRLRLPGAELAGIHYIRKVAEVESVRNALPTVSRVAVIGAGWIGSEVAASLRELGLDVALIGSGSTPLASLGPEVGTVYRDLHAEHGVQLHLDDSVTAFLGDTHVREVRTRRGASVAADLVIVGVGAEPRVELARQAGLDIDGGIAVDEYLQTSSPDIFAAGDVAAAWHPRLGRRLRIEHWANAQHQGIAASKNMLGWAAPYDRIPYFFSDQYDFGMEYRGHVRASDRIVFRGDPRTRELLAFWIVENRVVAAMNGNVWDESEHLQALVESVEPVDESRLSNPAVPLDLLQPVP